MIYIKTKNEIDLIRESCKIVARTLEKVGQYIKPGVTTKELDLIAEDFILSQNAIPAFKGYQAGNNIPFPASICSSIDEEVVHGIPGSRKLKDGEIVSIDIGVVKKGFYGDAALTFEVGNVSLEKKQLMKVTEESLYIGIEEAVEKNRVHDISFAIQQYVESFGYGIVRELCGHGVGKYLHEDPSVPNFGRKGTGAKLKKGMTIAIEPMITLGKHNVLVAYDGWTVLTEDNSPAAHFEHTILITDGKPEILSKI